MYAYVCYLPDAQGPNEPSWDKTQTETERRDIILLKVVFFRSLLVYLRVTFESGVEGIRLLPLDDPTNEMDNTTQVNKHEHAHTINHDVT